MKKKSAIINKWAAFFLVLSSCTPRDSDFFDYEVHEIADIAVADTLFPQAAVNAGRNTGRFSVVSDSLLITYLGRDSFFEISQLNTGDSLGILCRRGRGPGELLAALPGCDSDAGVFRTVDPINSLFCEIDVQRSLETGSTEYLGTYKYAFSTESIAPITSAYRLSEGKYLLFNPGYSSGERHDLLEIPYYAIFENNSPELKVKIPLGRPGSVRAARHRPAVGLGQILYPSDALNKEKDRLAFVLGDFPVYGYIDLETGKREGFRLSGHSSFNGGDLLFQFSGVCSDESRLYALYHGRQEPFASEGDTYLYVMDWLGNLVRKYVLRGVFDQIVSSKDKVWLSSRVGTRLYYIDKEILSQ